MFSFAGIFVIALIAIGGTNGQESCTTTAGGRGTCISIGLCTPLLALLRQSSLPPAKVDELRRSHCGMIGHMPKVCCSTIGGQEVTTPVPSPPDVSQHPNLRLINDNKCGYVTEEKIIMGNKTRVLEFPWMVLIGYNSYGQTEVGFECGGTLINKRWVLTAAHCLTGLPRRLSLALVRVGEHDLNTERDCDQEEGRPTVCANRYQDIPVERYVVHNAYRTSGHSDDIGLIRLNGDADFERTNNVRPICLPVGPTANLIITRGVATGWGRTEYGLPSPDLLKVWLDIMPNAECATVYQKHQISITYKQLCAGGKNGKDSCAGDSGGPLQFPDSNTSDGLPRWYQFGVVSFGTQDCGVLGYPGVYTRISYYVPWILDNIDE